MANDLERHRDHCRQMAALTELDRPKGRCFACRSRWDSHVCAWSWQTCACTCQDADRPQPPTDAERLLWSRLADEIDAYLNAPAENGLWEDNP